MVYTEFQKIGDFKSQRLEMTNKLHTIRKVLMKAIQNVLFTEFELLCQKFWVFLSKFWHFLQCPLTKYGHVMWSKKQTLKIFSFFPNSTFNIKKSHKISNGKALYFKSCQQKTHPPVSLGLRYS